MRALVLLALLTACNDKGGEGDDRVSAILELEGDVAAGETVYGGSCAACHGGDGSGGTGPDLVESFANLGDEEIVSVIIDGKGSMPAQSSLEDQDVADVLAYGRDTFGG
jgi:cytochrome c551